MPSPVAAAAPLAGGQADPMQQQDAWQQFLAQQAQQQQQQPQQPQYNPTTNTTPAPYRPDFVAGLAPLGAEGTGRFNFAQGSTSQPPVSPLAAPGDVETGQRGPPSIDEMWGMVYALQQQVATLHAANAAMTAQTGMFPNSRHARDASAFDEPERYAAPGREDSGAPPGRRWPVQEPRNLQSAFRGMADEEDLRDIDKKDVVPPSKYRGDASMWRH